MKFLGNEGYPCFMLFEREGQNFKNVLLIKWNVYIPHSKRKIFLKMKNLIEEIEKSVESEMYFSTLFLLMTLPDICAAIEDSNYQTNSTKYRKWFNEYLAPINPSKYGENGQLKADHMYIFRCKLLHQGTSSEQSKTGYQRLLFVEPNSKEFGSIKSLHCVSIGSNTPEQSLLVNIKQFSIDLIKAYQDWKSKNENSANYRQHYPRVIKRYENGIAPIFGARVIG